MIHLSNLRVTGRCLLDGGVLWLTFPLCEVAFRVSGATRLSLTLRTEDPKGNPEKLNIVPRYAVFVNRLQVENRRLTEAEGIISLPLLPAEETEIRLVKLSECTQSILGLADIETDGVLSPLPEPALRLEFIGDSITCGYGVETRDPEEHFSTATENAARSYAGLVASSLGAAPMLTAFSGHGIVSGYTDNPAVRNESELVPPYYEKMGRLGFRLPSGRLLEEIPWDFSRFRPQAIVINLGTNDLSWCQDDPDRHALFRQEYIRFLKVVRARNPKSRILCVLGLMGTGLNGDLCAAVEAYRQETQDNAIRAVTVSEQDQQQDGAGADYHPSDVTQRKFAAFIQAELLKTLIQA